MKVDGDLPEESEEQAKGETAEGAERPVEEEEAGDQTVIRANDDDGTEATEIKKEEDTEETTAQEAEHVSETPAAKGEEAEKSVGD